MREHVRLGRVAGIPIGLNLSVLVVFALITDLLATEVLPQSVKNRSTGAYLAVSLVVATLFFGALLAHELAHAVAARHYGVRVERITLWMLGGVAQLAGEPPTARADLAVALVGPLVSLAAGGLFVALGFAADVGGAPALLVAGLTWLGGINLLLAVFNLLPGAPLDGGRVLRAFLWLRTGDRFRAATVAARAGRRLGGALIALGVLEALTTGQVMGGLWFMLIGWFLMSAASAEGRSAVRGGLLAGLVVGDVMTRDPPALPAWQPVEAALERALSDRHEVYAVVDVDGVAVGLVTVARLTVPARERSGWHVGDVALPLAHVPTAAPDEPVTVVLDRIGEQQTVAVMAAGRLAGVLTPEDVRWALHRASLQHTSG